MNQFIDTLERIGLPYNMYDGVVHINSDVVLLTKLLTHIPENVRFTGNLRLNNPDLTSLPKDFYHHYGSLDLSGSGVKSLTPLSNNSIKGYLNLDGIPCKTLPSGLTIHGFLSIENTYIEHIPFGTYVLGGFYHTPSKLQCLEGIQIKGYFVTSGILSDGDDTEIVK